jgi:hypothetical protein
MGAKNGHMFCSTALVIVDSCGGITDLIGLKRYSEFLFLGRSNDNILAPCPRTGKTTPIASVSISSLMMAPPNPSLC